MSDLMRLPADIDVTMVRRNARQLEVQFANGRGVSVINDGYGRESGLYEVAVLDTEGQIDYDSPITAGGGGVIGWQSAEEVADIMRQVAGLEVGK